MMRDSSPTTPHDESPYADGGVTCQSRSCNAAVAHSSSSGHPMVLPSATANAPLFGYRFPGTRLGGAGGGGAAETPSSLSARRQAGPAGWTRLSRFTATTVRRRLRHPKLQITGCRVSRSPPRSDRLPFTVRRFRTFTGTFRTTFTDLVEAGASLVWFGRRRSGLSHAMVVTGQHSSSSAPSKVPGIPAAVVRRCSKVAVGCRRGIDPYEMLAAVPAFGALIVGSSVTGWSAQSRLSKLVRLGAPAQ